MVSPPQVGQIIRLRSWHGVVLDVFTNEAGKTILRVQTVRNVFRRLNPEFIELDLAPDAVEPASLEDLRFASQLDLWRHAIWTSDTPGNGHEALCRLSRPSAAIQFGRENVAKIDGNQGCPFA
jgi:hypothetical protein